MSDEQTELEFLQDMNALLSEALEGKAEAAATLRAVANEIRNRISDLEEGDPDAA